MTAAIGVQLRLNRLPSGIPYGIPILDIDMDPLLVRGAVIVAVGGDSAQARVLIKAIAPRRIGHQGKKVLAAQIVDPGERGAGHRYNIFPPESVKVSKLHRKILLHR